MGNVFDVLKERGFIQQMTTDEKIKEKLFNRYINQSKKHTHKVLVEEYEDGYSIGHTENYIKCYIPQKLEESTFCDIKIEKPFKDGALAKII